MTFVDLFNLCAELLYTIRDFALQFISLLGRPLINGYSILDAIFVFFVTTLAVRLILAMAPN